MRTTIPAIGSSISAVAPMNRKFIGPYRIVSSIKNEPGARVLLGIYFKNLWFKRCIIKEAIENSTSASLSMRQRLSHQYFLHTHLCEYLPIAKVLALQTIGECHYLVLEYIGGKLLQQRVDALYKDKTFLTLKKRQKVLLVSWLMQAVNIVGDFHQHGYVHRDISASNFLVAKSGKLFLLDLELAYSLSPGKPSYFRGWTLGYSSPQQIKNHRPCEKDDVYSLGGLMILMLAHKHPKELELQNPKGLVQFLSHHIEYADIIDLIIRCLDLDPERRPTLSKIQKQLTKYYEFKTRNA